jgi:peptidoglycan/LPS O-acetylase OafA/YrhL
VSGQLRGAVFALITTMAPAKQHRLEIQGLRAVAAFLVAAYHIWFGRVSGGVDVFFVVSAFLITTSLVKQVETQGSIRFVAFWGNLLKRLVPAALFVLVVVVIASILWLPRGRWDDAMIEIVSAALYLENWYLAHEAIDYLDQTGPSPVRHFWALSAQGQFYVLWPLLVTALVLVATKTGRQFRKVAYIGFGAVFVLSLAFSIVATELDQRFTYFNTFARLWEFSIGALLALSISSIRLTMPMRIGAGWIGLVGILSCGLVLQVSQVFPGYAALWPTLCAALILIAGTTGKWYAADKLLTSAPLVKMGDASYSLYLWHWPIYVFFRILSGHEHPTFVDGIFIIGVSILLALATTHWLENPVRDSGIGAQKSGRALAFGGACVAVLLSVVFGWHLYAERAEKFDGRQIAASDPDYPGAMAMDRGFRYRGRANVPVYPGPLAVEEDRPALYEDNCFQDVYESTPVTCVYGDPKAPKTVALVGGSHAAHWLPTLQALSAPHGWKVVVYTKNRCLLTTEMIQVFGEDYVSCREWNDKVMAELLQHPPQIVFTTATTGTGRDEHTPAGYVEQWRRLTAAGIRVIAVRDTPRMDMNVPECVELNGPQSPECSRPREAVLASTPPYKSIEGQLQGVVFLDLNGYLCRTDVCPSVIGNVLVYRDDSHLTTLFARTLAPALDRELTKRMADAGSGRRSQQRQQAGFHAASPRRSGGSPITIRH